MSDPEGILAKALFWMTGRKGGASASAPNCVGCGISEISGAGTRTGSRTGSSDTTGHSSSPGHLLLGAAGEEVVAAKAKALGWKILARNWRPEQEDARRFGRVAPRSRGLELDVVALDSGTLVFVEVRTRTTGVSSAEAAAHNDLLDPSRLFGKSKQGRFLRAARCWLLYKDMWHYPCRFDLFCVGSASGEASGGALEVSSFSIEHYSNVLEDCHAMDSRNTTWQPW